MIDTILKRRKAIFAFALAKLMSFSPIYLSVVYVQSHKAQLPESDTEPSAVPSALLEYTNSQGQNLSREINLLFVKWYQEHVNSNLTTLLQLNTQQAQSFIQTFMVSNSTVESIASELIAREYQGLLQQAMQSENNYSKLLMEGNLSQVRSEAGSMQVAAIYLPGSIDDGQYIILDSAPLQISILWYKETVGQADILQDVYEGDDGHHAYAHAKNQINDGSLSAGITSLIGTILGIGFTFSVPSLGTSAVIAGIISAGVAAAGGTMALLGALWLNDLITLYDSTYGNQGTGNKCMDFGYSLEYFYPSYSLTSPFSMYGYKEGGNVVYFLDGYPITSSTIGQPMNSWYYGGDPY